MQLGTVVGTALSPVNVHEALAQANPVSASPFKGDVPLRPSLIEGSSAISGVGLEFATFLGGAGWERDPVVVRALDGTTYLVGTTSSPDLSTPQNAFDPTFNGDWDVFVARVSADGRTLVSATYVGGRGWDEARGAAIDRNGSLFVTGSTTSVDFPVTNGSFDDSQNGSSDCFLFVLTANTSSMLFSTFLGGLEADRCNGLHVNRLGETVLVGATSSKDFPMSGSAMDRNLDGELDGFFARVSASGANLSYSTYLGGGGIDSVSAVAADPQGNLTLVGHTNSDDFPVSSGAYDDNHSYRDAVDAFIMGFEQGSASPTFSTYFGGQGDDAPTSVAVIPNGTLYITGMTTSSDLPLTKHIGVMGPSALPDGFLAAIDSSGRVLTFSTYLGGNGTDIAFALSTDSSGRAYVVGQTDSQDFPVSKGAIDTIFNGRADSFVTVINMSSGIVLYSTYLGGPGDDAAVSLWQDVSMKVVIGGWTESSNFPVTLSAYDQSFNGIRDFYLAGGDLAPSEAFRLLISTDPPGLEVAADGLVKTSPIEVWCTRGTSVLVSAGSPQELSDVRLVLANWSDGGKPSHVILCDRDRDLVATFVPSEFRITISTTPVNLSVRIQGVALMSPVSIWCKTATSVALTAVTPQGSSLTRYVFAGWSHGGPPDQILPCQSPRSILGSYQVEHFVVLLTEPYGLDLEVNTNSSRSPSVHWCLQGTEVSVFALSPQARNGTEFHFRNWSVGNGQRLKFVCIGPVNLTATFEARSPQPGWVPWFLSIPPVILVIGLIALVVLTTRKRRRRRLMVSAASSNEGNRIVLGHSAR
jgi:hypothetical protein